jgi:hypothetical protein
VELREVEARVLDRVDVFVDQQRDERPAVERPAVFDDGDLLVLRRIEAADLRGAGGAGRTGRVVDRRQLQRGETGVPAAKRLLLGGRQRSRGRVRDEVVPRDDHHRDHDGLDAAQAGGGLGGDALAGGVADVAQLQTARRIGRARRHQEGDHQRAQPGAKRHQILQPKPAEVKKT